MPPPLVDLDALRDLQWDSPPPTPPFQRVAPGVVVRIEDGDTMVVKPNRPLAWAAPAVRVASIDAPELNGPDPSRALAAKAYVQARVLGQSVVLHVRGTDLYGRVVGDVEPPGGGDLASELVAAGLADPVPSRFNGFYFDVP